MCGYSVYENYKKYTQKNQLTYISWVYHNYGVAYITNLFLEDKLIFTGHPRKDLIRIAPLKEWDNRFNAFGWVKKFKTEDGKEVFMFRDRHIVILFIDDGIKIKSVDVSTGKEFYTFVDAKKDIESLRKAVSCYRNSFLRKFSDYNYNRKNLIEATSDDEYIITELYLTYFGKVFYHCGGRCYKEDMVDRIIKGSFKTRRGILNLEVEVKKEDWGKYHFEVDPSRVKLYYTQN